MPLPALAGWGQPSAVDVWSQLTEDHPKPAITGFGVAQPGEATASEDQDTGGEFNFGGAAQPAGGAAPSFNFGTATREREGMRAAGRNACMRLLLLAGARCERIELTEPASVEMLVAAAANPFLRRLELGRPTTATEREILSSSPSLRVDTKLGARVFALGDRVRLRATHGSWRVVEAGDAELGVERIASETELRTTVPTDHAVIAGPAHLAWNALNAAACRGCLSRSVCVFARADSHTYAIRRCVEAFL